MAKLVEIKTKETNESVEAYINQIYNEERKNDCLQILQMMKKATNNEPKIWGNGTIGFGNKIYTSPKTGRSVEWYVIGVSPRKKNISLSLEIDLGKHKTLLDNLGKHKTGVGCLYIDSLQKINMEILNDIILIAAKK